MDCEPEVDGLADADGEPVPLGVTLAVRECEGVCERVLLCEAVCERV